MRTATAALCAYCCGIVPVGCAGAVWLFPQLCAGVLCVVHGGGGDALFAEPHERWYAGAAAGVADALQCGGDSSVWRHGGGRDAFPAVDTHGDDAAGADILGGCSALSFFLGSACALAGAGGSEDSEMTGRGVRGPCLLYTRNRECSGSMWHASQFFYGAEQDGCFQGGP